MRHHIQLAGVCLLASSATVAMSPRDAGENMLYFEHARLATEHCERQGFRVREAYEAWARVHSARHVEAADALRLHAARGGLSRMEQEAVVKEAVATQRELAREHIAKKGANCRQFDAALQMYSSLLKR